LFTGTAPRRRRERQMCVLLWPQAQKPCMDVMPIIENHIPKQIKILLGML